MNDKNGCIGIFDSGVGGLKILSDIRRKLPKESFIYIFDRSHAPYGKRGTGYVRRRADKICSYLINCGAKVIIVACNTATAAAIDFLRKKYTIPIIGIEPPVKPAVTQTNGKVLLLCTPLTAKQERIKQVIEKHGQKRVDIAPCPNLATVIENNFSDLISIKEEINKILHNYKNAGYTAVALGCTHYYYVKELISEALGGVKCFDACDGVTNRLEEILINKNLLSNKSKPGKIKYIYL